MPPVKNGRVVTESNRTSAATPVCHGRVVSSQQVRAGSYEGRRGGPSSSICNRRPSLWAGPRRKKRRTATAEAAPYDEGVGLAGGVPQSAAHWEMHTLGDAPSQRSCARLDQSSTRRGGGPEGPVGSTITEYRDPGFNVALCGSQFRICDDATFSGSCELLQCA